AAVRIAASSPPACHRRPPRPERRRRRRQEEDRPGRHDELKFTLEAAGLRVPMFEAVGAKPEHGLALEARRKALRVPRPPGEIELRAGVEKLAPDHVAIFRSPASLHESVEPDAAAADQQLVVIPHVMLALADDLRPGEDV